MQNWDEYYHKETKLTYLQAYAFCGYVSSMEAIIDEVPPIHLENYINARTITGKSALTEAIVASRCGAVVFLLDRFGYNQLDVTHYCDYSYPFGEDFKSVTPIQLAKALSKSNMAAYNIYQFLIEKTKNLSQHQQQLVNAQLRIQFPEIQYRDQKLMFSFLLEEVEAEERIE